MTEFKDKTMRELSADVDQRKSDAEWLRNLADDLDHHILATPQDAKRLREIAGRL